MALVEAGSPALPVIEEAGNRFGVDPAPKGLKKRFVKKTHTLASGDTVEYFAEEVIATTVAGATSSSDKAEDSAHVSGDTGSFILGVRNSNLNNLTNNDGDYSPIAVDQRGMVFTADAKAEDNAHVSGDQGSFILGVRNDNGALGLTSNDGDYSPIAVDNFGQVLTSPNKDKTLFASAARTASVNSADVLNVAGRGAHVVIDVTAIGAAPSVTFTVKGKDLASNKYYTILASAAITAVGTTVLRIDPSLTAAANTIAADILPRTFRVEAVHANADSITYSVGCSIV